MANIQQLSDRIDAMEKVLEHASGKAYQDLLAEVEEEQKKQPPVAAQK